MKFKVGDTVRVNTDRFDRFGPKQFGNIGVIIYTDGPGSLDIRVMFDDGANAYHSDDLELYKPPPLLQPDFTIDEIATAQEIMDQMG